MESSPPSSPPKSSAGSSPPMSPPTSPPSSPPSGSLLRLSTLSVRVWIAVVNVARISLSSLVPSVSSGVPSSSFSSEDSPPKSSRLSFSSSESSDSSPDKEASSPAVSSEPSSPVGSSEISTSSLGSSTEPSVGSLFCSSPVESSGETVSSSEPSRKSSLRPLAFFQFLNLISS